MREKQRQLRDEVKAVARAGGGGRCGRGRGVRAPIGAATSCRRNCSGARVGWSGFARRNGRWRRARRTRPPPPGEPADAAKPDPKAQYNFTDPESRIMKGPDGFVQAYNVQVAVDELQLIVGQAVTQETNDKKQLLPMITTIAQQSGDTPTQLLADAGYCSDENLTAIADTTIDAYISTRKQKHGERPGPCPRGPLPKTATIVDRMSRKLHHEDRRGGLCRAQRDRRTGDRPDQAGARLPAIPVAGIREGARGMVAGVHDAQHSQAVSPLRVTGDRRRAPAARLRMTAARARNSGLLTERSSDHVRHATARDMTDAPITRTGS